MGVLPIVLVVLAAALRIPGCFSELWLDEIWTLLQTQELESVLEIFTEFRSFNNHHLNSLLIYFLGDHDGWEVYRIHSLAAGIGSVALAWHIARRAGRVEAIVAALLMAGSYLMIYYSSEARGYALAVFFAMAAYLAVRRFAEEHAWRWALLFWLCTCLGLLSHLMYLHVLIGTFIWLVVELGGERGKRSSLVGHCAQCFGAPVLLSGCYYYFIVRRMEISGPEYDLMPVLMRASSLAGGGPEAGPLSVGVGVLVLGLSLWSVLLLRRQGRSEWIFFSIVIFLSPLATLILTQPDVIYVRYFLVNIGFALIAVSYLLAEMVRRGLSDRALAITLVLAYLAGNGVHTVQFFHQGRGGFLNGLRYMTEQEPLHFLLVTGDHDFRVPVYLRYYGRFFAPEKEILYLPKETHAPRPPRWMLCHELTDLGDVPATRKVRGGRDYRLVKAYYGSSLSIWGWFFYRLE
ncbi:MAG: glycosyltransferase family 39 protein [Planctomycetota bacterium]